MSYQTLHYDSLMRKAIRDSPSRLRHRVPKTKTSTARSEEDEQRYQNKAKCIQYIELERRRSPVHHYPFFANDLETQLKQIPAGSQIIISLIDFE